MNATVLQGDCIEVLRTLPDCSVDAVVTDPPYGLSFMGRKWDYDVPSVDVWAECLRVLKPGGHLLAFAGTRTQHRMCCRIEDAGFEIRDMIAWVYGSGFPKSMDVGKAIDKAAGAERRKIRTQMGPTGNKYAKGLGDTRPWMEKAAQSGYHEHDSDEPATAAAKKWHGWGTALKPALEPITVARKPLIGTVVANVLTHDTGAVNIEGCRVPGTDHAAAWDRPVSTNIGAGSYISDGTQHTVDISANKPSGRWPANLIHDGSEEVVALFPQSTSGANPTRRGGMGYHGAVGQDECHAPRGAESGSAARFFYCAKASKSDRDEGCEELELRKAGAMSGAETRPDRPTNHPMRTNHHPTVKPTDLMRYLCRLVTPPGGVVLDPFMGSGSTGKAAVLEGFRFVGIEREAEYVEIAKARIASAQPPLFT